MPNNIGLRNIFEQFKIGSLQTEKEVISMITYITSPVQFVLGLFFLCFSAAGNANVIATPLKDYSKVKVHFITTDSPVNTAASDILQPVLDLAEIDGELKRYHKLTFTWDAGVPFNEEDITYTDYRLNVTFTSPSGKSYTVPGYFAADGDAAETSAVSGTKWRCHFTALEIGAWTYASSFRTGNDIAISAEAAEGTPVAPIDGDTGSFSISETDKSGKDFRSKGKLEYVGEHFQQWTNGEYYLKVGSNSPENLLETVDFDDANSNRTFPAHIPDWNAGDPIWQSDKGKGTLGAINYLSEKGVNSQYFVLHRKGNRASPWSNPATSYYTYDVSRMDQWQIVFDHMMQKGLMAHLVLSESTNQSFFEVNEPSADPLFSDARKLYFREIVARFGYLNAVTWNIGEENGWDRRDLSWTGEEAKAINTQQRLDFAAYIDQLAYYDDFITVHNGHSSDARIFDNIQGDNSFTGISMQGVLTNVNRSKLSTQRYRAESAISDRKWVVYYDEAFSFNPIESDIRYYIFRQKVLWAALTAGAAGIEHYATVINDVAGDIYLDIEMEDLRYYDPIYSYMGYAYDFYIDNDIPFYNMYNQDDIVSTGWCHGDDYENYVVYMEPENLSILTIDLVGDYEVKWFNPRTGGALIDGTVTNLSTGEDLDVGLPPSDLDTDWVVYLRNTQIGPVAVTGVEVMPEELNLPEGLSYILTSTIAPANAANKDVVWSSSDPSIVSVDADGTINALAIGQVIITATTVDGGFTDESEITVTMDVGTCTATSTVLMERYNNIEGSSINELLLAPNYPDNPTTTVELTEIQIPEGDGDLYGVRVSGYLCAPETGNYTFWIAGDDHVQLNLSPDNRTSNAAEIAFHESFTKPREWNKFTSQRSEEIQLLQGQTYYIEALLKEGTFGDHMAVGWRKPSDGSGNVPVEIVPGSVLSIDTVVPVNGVNMDPVTANIIIGENLQLNAEVFPSNATNQAVIWSSDDVSLVTVDGQGDIQGIGVGTTKVKATTVDGNFIGETTVNVSATNIPVTGVNMNAATASIFISEELQLIAQVQPIDATDQSVIWSSSNTAIVTVDANGNITGNALGTATISTTTVDGDFVAETEVTVVENTVAVTGVSIDYETVGINVGELLLLSAIVEPVDADDQSVIWSSNDPSIVTVDSAGNIVGVSGGTTNVIVTTVDGGFTAETIVTVSAPVVPVAGVVLDIESADILVGEQLQLTAQVQPSNASDQSVVWSSDDTSIVTVDSEGNITGVSLGSTKVIVETVDGNFTAEATITVSEPIQVTGITVTPATVSIEVGENLQLLAEVLPMDANDQSVIWSSDDTSIVTVDSEGNILGITQGTTIINATTVDGQFVAQATIEVVDSSLIDVTGISLDFETIDVQVGESIGLDPMVLPEDASDSSVVWSSDDSSVVTVDVDGTITGITIGTATITVTTVDGDFSTELAVTVIAKEVLMVYPNPADDYITVSGVNELIFVSVFTSSGQLLNRTKTVPGGTKIYVADLPSGIYFVGLDNGRKLPFLKR